MTVDFRCEKCGKLLNVDAEPGSKVRCPHCSKKLRVPAALAGLPRPQIPGTPGDQPPQYAAAPPPPGAEEEEFVEAGHDPMMAVMASMMPWILSVFFHLGLALIMLFFVMVSAQQKQKDLFKPDTARVKARRISRTLAANSANPNVTKSSNSMNKVKSYSNRESTIPSDSGKTKSRMELLGKGPSTGDPDAPFAPGGGGGGGGFYGTGWGDGAKYIIFVIDRSGSMVTVFDYVRLEMQLSISQMGPEQEFHIVLFADEKAIDGPRTGLVPGTAENKIAVVEFLAKDEIRPQGKTTALVALKRAFEVFNKVPNEGKLLLLLTDGEFSGIGGGSRYKGKSGNEAVLAWLRDNNKKGDVTINTFLFGKDPRAHAVMRKIAEESEGEFKPIPFDE